MLVFCYCQSLTMTKFENFLECRPSHAIEKVFQALQLGLPSSFFDELLFNTLDSIDWQSFKVTDQLKKEWQRGKQNKKKSLSCQKLVQFSECDKKLSKDEKLLTSPTIGLPSSFFDELLFNKVDSIDWQSFKVTDQLKKEWQRGKQNQKKVCRVKNSLTSSEE